MVRCFGSLLRGSRGLAAVHRGAAGRAQKSPIVTSVYDGDALTLCVTT